MEWIDILHAYASRLPEIVTLAVIIYGFIQMHRSDSKWAELNQRIDSNSQAINARVDLLYQELIASRKG